MYTHIVVVVVVFLFMLYHFNLEIVAGCCISGDNKNVGRGHVGWAKVFLPRLSPTAATVPLLLIISLSLYICMYIYIYTYMYIRIYICLCLVVLL